MAFWNQKNKMEGHAKKEQPTEKNRVAMVTTYGENFYSWNGKLYESDIVRACIRPKAKAAGKLVGKHIRDDPKKGFKVNPEPYIRYILEEPNPYMTGQQLTLIHIYEPTIRRGM